MQRETQLRLMREALAHIEQGTTVLADDVYRHPVAAYASPERLARETEMLFRRQPLMLGLSCSIPHPGDAFTDDRTGVPILVARGDDGVVRAFLNVCRHRGSRLVDGCGSHRAFTCPYHGWTYGLDGTLRGIPDQRSFPGVDKADHALVPLPTVERHGMIWVKPTPSNRDAPLDIAGHFGTLDAELASYGLENFHLWETRHIRRATNWKLIMDTFLEPYHFAVLHRKTVASVFISNLCLFEGFGPHLREVFVRHTMARERDKPESDWDFIRQTSVVYVLFPNVSLITQLDHVELWRLFPVPGRVDECDMVLDFLIPEPATTDSARGHWKRSMDLTVATVLEEDFPTAEGIQRGVTSGALTHACIGRNEPAVAHFERSVSEALGDAAPRERVRPTTESVVRVVR